MMSKVSVHILYNPNNDIHRNNIKNQLKILSGSSKTVTSVVSGIPGHVGESRVRGFMSAREKYCCYVDDDDCVLDIDYFDRAVDYLESHPDVMGYAGREMINIDGIMSESHLYSDEFLQFNEVMKIHHMQVFRTDLVKKYFGLLKRHKTTPEIAMHTKMLIDEVPIKVENDINYLWNRGNGETHVKADLDEMKKLSIEYISKFGIPLY